MEQYYRPYRQLDTSVEDIVKLSDSKAAHKTDDFLVVMDLEAMAIGGLDKMVTDIVQQRAR